MNVEEALNFTDASIFKKTGERLTGAQQGMIRELWSGRQNYKTIADNLKYTESYLKQDVGPKLWKLCSIAFGEDIKKVNFRFKIERAFNQGQICITSPRQDWGEAPDASIFYGRSDELAQLEEWIITERCRIVGLVGIGGIGKTHVSVKLAKQTQEKFDYVIWRSLRNSPSLKEILDYLLQFIANSQETHLLATVDEKISLLINYFQEHRCLLVLDDVETILRCGDYTGFYKQGYEDYGNFFKRLGLCSHNSCLVLMSREIPKEISLMRAETAPVRCFNLPGLSVQAGLQILQLKGCCCNLDAECTDLVKKYSGNPLLLKIVAEVIQGLFEGRVAEFSKCNILTIDKIPAFLQEHLNRLSELEYKLLYRLIINQKPGCIEELQSDNYPGFSQQTLITTLNSLVQRSLIETQKNHFDVQPLLREYMSTKLIELVCEEVKTGELALLKSHSLLNAEANDYIKNSQISFIIQPILSRLLNAFGDRNHLKNWLEEIRSKLQTQSLQELGYAADNILYLFSQLKQI